MTMNEENKVSVDTIVRTVVLLIALANQILAILGREKIPIAEETVYQVISLIATIVTSVIAWWKNNSFTKAAIEGDRVMKALKKHGMEE